MSAATATPAHILSGPSVERRLSVLSDFARVATMVGNTLDFEILSDKSVEVLATLAEVAYGVAEALLERDALAQYEREGISADDVPASGSLPAKACERLAEACYLLYRGEMRAHFAAIEATR
ncbi:hypothetical protein [Pseudofrankia inefficax]|uniref:Uncharacterized protein n=1 Tax=Pseudofrankia inefficax (strain DSM 45817 / CECT 9037 / DDB 130130 / EuI1c) TaxID=298654 RepID=E3J732_PSEI1|nr:hypothetical protein [Pseudofrankia inefficax]ADP84396.1 hypothetical protein FraEuI1c_6415 [Pseudofrankia inefficax]